MIDLRTTYATAKPALCSPRATSSMSTAIAAIASIAAKYATRSVADSRRHRLAVHATEVDAVAGQLQDSRRVEGAHDFERGAFGRRGDTRGLGEPRLVVHAHDLEPAHSDLRELAGCRAHAGHRRAGGKPEPAHHRL